MSDPQSNGNGNGNGTGPRGRRGKRFLSPSEKYEIWISLIRGEYTIVQAAERAGVDRSTIMKLRMVARQGALEALAASKLVEATKTSSDRPKTRRARRFASRRPDPPLQCRS